jgi:hypothetical protein
MALFIQVEVSLQPTCELPADLGHTVRVSEHPADHVLTIIACRNVLAGRRLESVHAQGHNQFGRSYAPLKSPTASTTV